MKRMSVLFIIFALLLMIVIPVNAEVSDKWKPSFNLKQTDWGKEDTSLQTAVVVFILADWAQTRYIASNPEFIETNPILGPNPSIEEVDQYFAICALGNTAIAYFLPKKFRKWWQVLSLSTQINFVNHNYNLGVKMQF